MPRISYFVTTNDPLRSAESSRRLLLEQESELDPEPLSSLLQEYEKGIDDLTIDPANRLQRTVQILKIEKSRLDKIEEKLLKIEKMYR